MLLCLTSMPQTTPLVDKLSMPAEQQDLLVLSLKLKHKTSAPQDITTTTKTLTQQINVHKREETVNQYRCKVRNLDVMFAAAVVGDGNNNVIGPFENALSQFHGKTVIPLCFGGFGEVNEDLDKVIQCLAREAASTDEGLTISPLVNTDRKGEAYHIMLQQFDELLQ